MSALRITGAGGCGETALSTVPPGTHGEGRPGRTTSGLSRECRPSQGSGRFSASGGRDVSAVAPNSAAVRPADARVSLARVAGTLLLRLGCRTHRTRRAVSGSPRSAPPWFGGVLAPGAGG